jgi:hypothetical protein
MKLRHFIVVLKEGIVEAAAERLQVLRLPGPPAATALAALEPSGA